MNGLSDQAVAAGPTLDLAAWRSGFDEVFARVASRFAQACSRKRARAYLLGLLSRTERKNSWTIAELGRHAGRDAAAVELLLLVGWRCLRRPARIHRRRAPDPRGVLICDETGFIKKGQMSAGVARQYLGTAGRIENCQVGVFLAYAVPGGGRAPIDRELYLPQAWTGEGVRCRQAGIPDDREFATKPELARQMIERAVGAGVSFGWVAGDEVYGQNTPLRDWLDEHDLSYVLAVPKSFAAATAARSNYISTCGCRTRRADRRARGVEGPAPPEPGLATAGVS